MSGGRGERARGGAGERAGWCGGSSQQGVAAARPSATRWAARRARGPCAGPRALPDLGSLGRLLDEQLQVPLFELRQRNLGPSGVSLLTVADAPHPIPPAAALYRLDGPVLVPTVDHRFHAARTDFSQLYPAVAANVGGDGLGGEQGERS